jgi:hypothetical protein
MSKASRKVLAGVSGHSTAPRPNRVNSGSGLGEPVISEAVDCLTRLRSLGLGKCGRRRRPESSRRNSLGTFPRVKLFFRSRQMNEDSEEGDPSRRLPNFFRKTLDDLLLQLLSDPDVVGGSEQLGAAPRRATRKVRARRHRSPTAGVPATAGRRYNSRQPLRRSPARGLKSRDHPSCHPV